MPEVNKTKDQNRQFTLLQIDSNRFEWKNFIDAVQKLGYKEIDDYRLSPGGNTAAMFKANVANNDEVKKLREKFRISSLGLESKNNTLYKPLLAEGSLVKLQNGETGTILEGKFGDSGYKIKLTESGDCVYRNPHEIKEVSEPYNDQPSPDYDTRESEIDDYFEQEREVNRNLNNLSLDEVIIEAMDFSAKKPNTKTYDTYSDWSGQVKQAYPGAEFKVSNISVYAFDAKGQEVARWEDLHNAGWVKNVQELELAESSFKQEDNDMFLEYANDDFDRSPEMYSGGKSSRDSAGTEIEDWDAIERNTDYEAELAGVQDPKDFEMTNDSIDLNELSDEELEGLADQNGCYVDGKDRTQIIDELNCYCNISQEELDEFLREFRGLSLDEAVDCALEEGTKLADFNFSPTIDFRYQEGKHSYTSQTEEYEELDSLDEAEWLEYQETMAQFGVTVEYNASEDEFVVTGMQDDNEEFLPESTERYTINDEDKRVIESVVKGTGFNFPTNIDFRYIDGKYLFTNETEEYQELDSLIDGEWEEYLETMAHYGTTVEYNSVDDVFEVSGMQDDNEDDFLPESTERYPINEEDKMVIESVVKNTGFKLLECRGKLKSSNQPNKLEILVESKDGLKETVVYDDDNLKKPWSIGQYQFNLITEAIASVKAKGLIKETVDMNKQKEVDKVRKEAYKTDPRFITKEEKERRSKRSQELLEQFIPKDRKNKLF